MLKLTKFPPPFGGGSTFYYTGHVIQRFIPHVYRARPLNGFENGSNLAENRKEYLLLTSWDVNFIFFAANSQKLPLNGSMEWNFFRNKEKACDASRATKFALVKSLRFSELFLGIILSEFRFTVFFPLGSGFMNPPPSVFPNRERKSPQRGLGRSLERMRHQCNFSAPPWAPT